MGRGAFVVLEAAGRSGKSTLARALVDRWDEDGIEFISVRAPGGTEVAEALRRELLAQPVPVARGEFAVHWAARADS